MKHLGAYAHPLVATVRTVVAERGLAVRADGDGRVGADDSSARWWRHSEERHDMHGVAQGTRRHGLDGGGS